MSRWRLEPIPPPAARSACSQAAQTWSRDESTSPSAAPSPTRQPVRSASAPEPRIRTAPQTPEPHAPNVPAGLRRPHPRREAPLETVPALEAGEYPPTRPKAAVPPAHTLPDRAPTEEPQFLRLPRS